MPIKHAVDHATQRVIVTAQGDLRLEDIAALYTELADRECLEYTQRFDARHATVVSSAEDVRRLVALTARLRADHGQSRTAFIAESDVSFGMARMYGTLAAETDSGFMVYRTIEDGDSWLGWQRIAVGQHTA